MNKVNLFFRKREPQFNSIEEVFGTVTSALKKTVDVICLQVPETGGTFRSLWKNIRYVKANRTAVNHITGHVNYIALGLGANTVLTIHDVQSSFTGNPIRDGLMKLLWYWIPGRIVKKITVISEFSKNELSTLIPFAKSKIEVVPNPVSPSFRHTPKPFNAASPRILHLGTKTNKNLERTVEALADISCTLVIIGKLTPSQTEHLASKGIDYENHYHIPFAEIVRHYEESDMVSFVSTYEGFGMPIIEANAVGRPVIAGNVTAMPEVAGDAALMVDPYDVSAIRSAIKTVIENDAVREDLVAKGLENVKRFTADTVAQQYLEIYQSIDKYITF